MFTKEDSNLCKGIAILMLLFHHLFNDYEEYAGYTVSYWPFTGERITFYALLCKICVAVFVFISGYGIADSYRRKFKNDEPQKAEMINFIGKKYWKLMCCYWFVFILTLLCQPLGWTVVDAYGNNVKAGFIYFLIDAAGLSFLFSTPTLNPTWWYMSLAIAIIIILPFLLWLMQKMGAVVVTAGIMIFLYLARLQNDATFYAFPMLMGALSCNCCLFEKIHRTGGSRKTAFLAKTAAELTLLIVFLHYRTDYNLNGIIDGGIAFMIAILSSEILEKIPLLSRLLGILGKNSANMFLVHNQLYSLYFLGFFYSFRYWWLILLVLTGVSLLVSLVIDMLKKRTGYDKFMKMAGVKLFLNS